MEPRRKPIPTPIARPSDVGLAPRPLAPARSRSMLPTVAALLTMTAMTATAAIGCHDESEAIKRDETTRIVTILHASPARVASPRDQDPIHAPLHDPTTPLPALGVLEEAPPPPPPPPAPPAPTTHPYPVKGGMKAVHPVPPAPTAPAMPGGLKVAPPTPIVPPTPIAPIKKPLKLGGDVAPAFPETT